MNGPSEQDNERMLLESAIRRVLAMTGDNNRLRAGLHTVMESTGQRDQLRMLVSQLIEENGGVDAVHVDTLNAELRQEERSRMIETIERQLAQKICTILKQRFTQQLTLDNTTQIDLKAQIDGVEMNKS